ncbi:uncharacterized protein VP01_1038g11 [Puccinia sorghi]|uniref:Myb/SANT-like domain-containing protein n=1 Tax=Puccinia sorghi TaxID=27349 RepID=A0A0L6VUT6_9BASI|nr:uncharacterized protein VP01_1038g11 [Puccinia sorghi]
MVSSKYTPSRSTYTGKQAATKRMMSSQIFSLSQYNLYAEEVSKELRKHFPKVEHVHDANKVKSKLSQGFKKDYNTFLACKDSSGFGWDVISCEITALDFGTPFPEFQRLYVIFGLSGATREAACLAIQQLLELQSCEAGAIQTDDSGSRNPLVSNHIATKNSPSAYLSRSHMKKDSISVAIESLVGFLNSQTNNISNDRKNNIQQVMALYQQVHAPHTLKEDSLASFKIFRNNINFSAKHHQQCFPQCLASRAD